MNEKKHNYGFLAGIIWMIFIGVAAIFLSNFAIIKKAGLSPLTLAIGIGMIFGNLRLFPVTGKVEQGILFVQKRLLRIGIILYGFRISFQEILGVGAPGFIIDFTIIASTFLIGTYLGVRLFKLDLQTSILNSSGSSICGAAAIIATEGVVQGGSKKTAVAVSTVVLFGTISMFLYPLLYSVTNMTPDLFGVYIGSTIHEVAQVVVAGETLGPDIAATAVIAKMTRVMLLAPFLILLGWYLSRRVKTSGEEPKENRKPSISIPWFAVGFIAVSGLHSLEELPKPALVAINSFDTLLLSSAMAALGLGTTFHKMRGVGIRPFLHGLFLFVFLVVGGYAINRAVSSLF